MVRKNLLKSLSVVMACMMAVMTVACGSNTTADDTQASAIVETQEEQELEKSLLTSAAVTNSEGESGKVETVYVTADANGAVDDVIVSEWLRNASASNELADSTELKDIVNVKGSETFTENSDGTLTWDAEGSDIYYQGTTDKELPVDMKITYTLDGKEIAPADLAGKSGKVTIRFEYENKAKQTVDVDGKNIEVYTPFAMVSGMMLDSDKFANVEISNGKVISDGGKYIVMGVALPGLKESLDISDDKWDELEDSEEIKGKLSNSFEITADTTDFELGMTITMASSDILSDFGLTDITGSGKIDELKDDMGELNDGSTKLVDGTKELKDGTTKLRDGSQQLYDGTGKLYDGTKELKDGTVKLADGTGRLVDGASQLSDGASKLSDGASQLSDGTNTLNDGTGKLYEGSKTLYDGVVSYTDGVSKVNSGAGELAKGVASAKDGSAQLVSGTAQLQSGAGSLVDGAQKLSEGTAKLDQLSSAFTMIAEKKSALVDKHSELSSKAAALQAVEGFLTTPGMGCPEQLVPVISQLSGGKITSAAEAEAIRDAGLAALASSNSGSVAQEPAGAELDEVEVNSGVITKEETEEPKEEAKEEVKEEVKEEAPKVEEAAAPVEKNDEVTQPQTPVSTPVTIEDEATPEAAAPTTDADTTLPVVGATDEKLYTQQELDELVAKIVEQKVQEQLQAAIEQYISSPEYQAQVRAKMQSEVAGTVASVSTYAATLASTRASLSAVNETLGFLNDTLASFNAFVTPEEQASGVTFDTKIAFVQKSLVDLQNGASQLYGGAQKLQGGIDAVATGAGKLDLGLGQLSTGATTLATGTGALVANNDKLKSGAKDLSTGAGQLNDGASKLKSGAGELKDGAAKLSDGTKELKSGTEELNSGAGELNNGAGELMDGAKELNDGAGELNDGIITLDDGVAELLDGVCKLDEEGIKKLYEAFDGDLTEFADKMTAIQEAGNNYTSFGGASDAENSSVKFIIKTEGVKAIDL